MPELLQAIQEDNCLLKVYKNIQGVVFLSVYSMPHLSP
jgi:hypothetical protein